MREVSTNTSLKLGDKFFGDSLDLLLYQILDLKGLDVQ